MTALTPEAHLDVHRAAGRDLVADGVRSFVREEGTGETVLCMHGVPASSFLYRKVLVELADRGLRGVAFDLPGLGFAERPRDFDYRWSSLARWSTAAVEALDLGPLHLVVHDIGGPVGIRMAADLGDQVRSLTILNTPLDPATFRQPPIMRPFSTRLGRLYLAAQTDLAFLASMYLQGVADRSAVSRAQLLAYKRQLVAEDGGAAFLQIMRGFELTEELSALIRRTVRAIPARQVLWGAKDPALTLQRWGRVAQEVADVEEVQTVPGKHFLQEDHPAAVAEGVARLADRA